MNALHDFAADAVAVLAGQCVCGAPLGSTECNLRAHLRGPQPIVGGAA